MKGREIFKQDTLFIYFIIIIDEIEEIYEIDEIDKLIICDDE